MSANQILRFVIPAAVFTSIAGASFMLYFVLGMLTGIYGMCRTASDWWNGLYETM